MDDRELLELAAKAAGYEDWKYCEPVPGEPALYIPKAGGVWMPLIDDGDALRLAVQLEQKVKADFLSSVIALRMVCDFMQEPYYATRRAIVRAAAEIGRSMP